MRAGCSAAPHERIIQIGSGGFIRAGWRFHSELRIRVDDCPSSHTPRMDTNVEQLPRDFIAASHVARVAIRLANLGQSVPEQELNRAWRLIEVARGIVRQHAAFRLVSTEPPRTAEKPEAEFVSLPGPGKRCPISGLSRSTLYQLAALGKIRMISLRRDGNLRGKRLVVVESVRHYLRMLDAHQNPVADG
jgi:hypothetical protein